MYGGVDIDAESGYRNHSLRLYFVSIAVLFSKTQTQILTLTVNGSLGNLFLSNIFPGIHLVVQMFP